jgi:hypothetical protein
VVQFFQAPLSLHRVELNLVKYIKYNGMLQWTQVQLFTIYALVKAIVIFHGTHVGANLLFKCTFKRNG